MALVNFAVTFIGSMGTKARESLGEPTTVTDLLELAHFSDIDFLPRDALVQSAVLRSHVVCPSVCDTDRRTDDMRSQTL